MKLLLIPLLLTLSGCTTKYIPSIKIERVQQIDKDPTDNIPPEEIRDSFELDLTFTGREP